MMTGPSPKYSTSNYHYSVDSLMEGRRMAERYGCLRTRPLTFAEQQAMTPARTPDGFKAFFIHTNEGEIEMAQDTQAAPITNSGPSMHDLVVAAVLERKEIGLKEYGTILQSHNGRDQLKDSIEEILDLACYLMAAKQERDSLQAELVNQDTRDFREGQLRREIRENSERHHNAMEAEELSHRTTKQALTDSRTRTAELMDSLWAEREKSAAADRQLERERQESSAWRAELEAANDRKGKLFVRSENAVAHIRKLEITMEVLGLPFDKYVDPEIR